MPNSIDININSGNNSMDSLSFHWKALFRNGDFINQFEDGIEHKFQEVKDGFNELQFFYLYNKNNIKDKFIVDLENGFIFRNEIKDYPNKITEQKKNIRLIYFRTRRKKITEQDLKEISEIIWYTLGFQYQDENDNNHKIILKIDEQGNWILE